MSEGVTHIMNWITCMQVSSKNNSQHNWAQERDVTWWGIYLGVYIMNL
jgi:hypothetical protein